MKTKTTEGDLTQEVKELREQNAALTQEVERLKDEIIRLVNRNLDITERLEEDTELRRRVQVAREIFAGNLERQRNADLLDDGQLMAILEIRVEENKLFCQPDFDVAALAEKIGVSKERLSKLFRKQTIYRTPEAYIDNLRLLTCMRMLREHPQYNIAVIAEEVGFANVRTMQRRFQDAIGMTPVEYRLMTTKDL